MAKTKPNRAIKMLNENTEEQISTNQENLKIMLSTAHRKGGKTLWVCLSSLKSKSDWEKRGSRCARSQVNMSSVISGWIWFRISNCDSGCAV